MAAPPPSPELVEVTLALRPRNDTTYRSALQIGAAPVSQRHHLARDQIGRLRGAHPQDLEAVRAWATKEGLQLLGETPERRLLRVAGPLATLARLFSVAVYPAHVGAAAVRTVRGQPRPPAGIAQEVVAVLGLDTRPLAQPRLRRLPLPDPRVPLAQAAPLSYAPPAVAQLYQFPAAATGAGICVGLLELGGGYQPQDLSAYFSELQLPMPEVVAVAVDGGSDQPTGNPDSADGEVALDIEVVGSAAPGIRIATYFAPNTDQGFLAAILTAVHDQANHPQVLSISWGGPEVNWPRATMTAFDQAFEDAALVGMTICVAAGDNGSSDGLADGLAHVDYPAASPYVLACGGTRLLSSQGRITDELVWNDQPQDGATGGGVSAVFPLPPWQSQAGVPSSVNPGHFQGRGLPDVAGDADPQTGYRILVDGTAAVFGGTSAVAPLWAALLARCAQELGRELGFLNPLLYRNLAAQLVCHDITQGNNGAYSAAVGWDACTGWGSPDGVRLLAALRG